MGKGPLGKYVSNRPIYKIPMSLSMDIIMVYSKILRRHRVKKLKKLHINVTSLRWLEESAMPCLMKAMCWNFIHRVPKFQLPKMKLMEARELFLTFRHEIIEISSCS
jgi:hypothetical protein